MEIVSQKMEDWLDTIISSSPEDFSQVVGVLLAECEDLMVNLFLPRECIFSFNHRFVFRDPRFRIFLRRFVSKFIKIVYFCRFPNQRPFHARVRNVQVLKSRSKIYKQFTTIHKRR
jgi:hypothetical protein